MLPGKGRTTGLITTQDCHQARCLNRLHSGNEGMLSNTARAQ
jgi:hypothetical protein